MTRRRASTLAEALVAAVILAVVGGMLVVSLAQATQAGQRAMLGAQARRLLQQELEQIRSGRGIPGNGTNGPFTITVTSWAPGQPGVSGGTPVWTPDCYGGSPCSNTLVLTGVPSVTFVQIVITYTGDGSVLANGTTSTPP
jgi:type II secretory pathway pseudopilin PulG